MGEPIKFVTDEQWARMLEAASDTQINAVDFATGPRIMKIRGAEGRADPKKPLAIYLEGVKLPWLPCVTMRRLINAHWGAPNSEWIGRRVELYCDPEVEFGEGKEPKKVGGIRILRISDSLKGDREAVSVQSGRGKMKVFRIAHLPAESKGPTHEEKRAKLIDAIAKAGKVDDADAAFGPSAEWDAETCVKVAAWLRGGGAA
jgi:hypothetical protein